ncbi:host-nuclease inhibitor Gam family protein [Treponema phagedenis]|uniref:host-nuclease inhibitor Gam family protein n=1 Tax=Treponema phagedenis TaxID=162 RepID=UPI001652DA54|nr:host-nuclease inhibitor Gam family protein [Treponema phagedenis]
MRKSIAHLKTIGLLEHELDLIDAKSNKEISAIKEKAAKDGEGKRKQIAELAAKIGAFAEYNRDELFIDKKTIELTFGTFGFRKSTSIIKTKTTVGLLEKLGLTIIFDLKKEADKEKMAELDDETLAQVDAVRKVKDTFFCEANKEEVNRDLLKSAG